MSTGSGSIGSTGSSGGPPITLSGFSSGIPVNDIITKLLQIEQRPLDLLANQRDLINAQQSTFSSINLGVNTLKTSLDALSTSTFSNPDLFNRKSSTSSDTTKATATVTNDATIQTLNVNVTQLATGTKAESVAANFQSGVGKAVDATTLVSAIYPKTISSGTFTLFRNGVTSTVTVDNTVDTLGDVLNKINTASGGTINASVDASGKITLDGTGGTLNVGGTGDTSNFLDLTALKTAPAGITVSGVNSLTQINPDVDVTTAAANLNTPVTAGSVFKVGGASITVGNKSLGTIISEINSTPAAGVFASYNATTNKIQFVSKSTGSQLINLEDTSGNFLAATGLINGSNVAASQTPGVNSQFTVNGTSFSSSSNNVTGDKFGQNGITLNLVSTGTTTISVTQNTNDLDTALKAFVSNLNNVISTIDTQTDPKNGILKGESSLVNFRNQLRIKASDQISGTTTYNTLASVGISTGAVNGAISTGTPVFQYDSSKFSAALAADPTGVKNLFTGANGIITQLTTIVKNAQSVDPTSLGLFKSSANSAEARIKQINDSIAAGKDRISQKEILLRNQYTAMETNIAKFQSQGQSITSLSASLAANK
ncbi:MAG: flagellar filament capping protein FliD [Cyanobacteria bacterium]|nr:flagellar filament capping protein FliD [Cyanobacteriota bacterium]